MQKLFPDQAAKYLLEKFSLRRSAGYLQQIATHGHDRAGIPGPVFVKAGKFRVYEQAALDAYAHRVMGPEVSSTTEYRVSLLMTGAAA